MSPNPPRKLGRKQVIHDPRVKSLLNRVDRSKLPTPPAAANWYGKQPTGGVPLFLNDVIGDCTCASVGHYVENSTLYTRGKPLVPSNTDILNLYEHSGYKPDNPSDPQSNSTDQGWTMLGQGGLMQTWAKGISLGGETNTITGLASVNSRNIDEIRAAIYLFGFVFTGAVLSEGDVESDKVWNNRTHRGPIAGGHEFLTCGYEQVKGVWYFDVITWNGIWTYDQTWLAKAVDDMLVVMDPVFFDARGISASGIDQAAMKQDLLNFTGRG